MVEPEPAFHGVRYASDFPDAPYVTRCRTVGLRNTGAALSPFNAFLLLQGLETLAVRLPRHESNTRAVAEFLAADPRVTSVSFVGFPDNPYYELAQRYLGGRAPSIMTFTVQRRPGGRHRGVQQRQAVQAPAEHGRREVSDHASRLHDPPAAHARGLEAGRASRPTWCACRSGSSTRTT